MNTVWSAVPREEDPESRSSSPASKQSLRHSGPDTNAASATQPKRSRTGKQRQRSETRDKSGKGTPVDSSAPEEKIGVSETQLPGKSNMETPVDGWTSCRGEVIDVTRSEAESGEPVHTSQPKADNEAGVPTLSTDPGQARRSPLEPESKDPWAATYKRVEVIDNDACKSWRDEIDKLLVFAGLFSAAVTAFTVEAYQWLDNPDDNTSTRALTRISQQLANSTGTPPIASEPFMAPAWVIRVNIFWFMSLILSFDSVLIGILCLQWIREFQRDVTHLTHKEALVIRQIRYEGFMGWKVPEIIAMLPLLLQFAMILFFIGLIDFLFAKNRLVASCVFVPVTLGTGFYFFTSLAPGFQLRFGTWKPWQAGPNNVPLGVRSPSACPYKSPLAFLLCRIFAGNWDSWLAIDLHYRRGCISSQPAVAALLIWLRENLFQEWSSLVDIVACFRSCSVIEQFSVLRLKFPKSEIMWEQIFSKEHREWSEWLFLRWTPEHSSPELVPGAAELWLRSSHDAHALETRAWIRPTAELNPVLVNAYLDLFSFYYAHSPTQLNSRINRLALTHDEIIFYSLHVDNEVVSSVLRRLYEEKPISWQSEFKEILEGMVRNVSRSPSCADKAMNVFPSLGYAMISALHDGYHELVAHFFQAFRDIMDICNLVHPNLYEQRRDLQRLKEQIDYWMLDSTLRSWIKDGQLDQIVAQPPHSTDDMVKRYWVPSQGS